ncbi:MAG: hypothetical protein ACO1SV_19265 [Fimbriimonas sp.]
MSLGVGLAMVAVAIGGQGDDDSALKQLHRLAGGTWEMGPVRQEFKLEDGVVRGLVVVGKGTPNEFRMRSTIGWDSRTKKTFYLDDHGGKSIYFGHIVKDGERLRWDFESIAGPEGKWRLWTWFVGDDEYHSSMDTWKDGKWVVSKAPAVFKRTK